MPRPQHLEVAVLLATYNGSRFLEQQIKSLGENSTPFVLHWLDDHSKDNTRELVRVTTERAKICLKEWHQPQHLGVPGAFFELMERADADIYLFCDQDDIWQPGKIDATVATLTPELRSPALSCSDFYFFRNDNPDAAFRLSQLTTLRCEDAVKESRLFMSMAANGHTQGFTRPLRDLYLEHKDIARSYAYMHDEWLHPIAVAAGTVRFLTDAPTTLFRWHGGNTSGAFFVWKGSNPGYLDATWEQRQVLRRALSRHAEGFIRAAETLPSGPKLDRLVRIAQAIANLNRRRSASSVLRMARDGIMWPSKRLALGLATTCLLSDAS